MQRLDEIIGIGAGPQETPPRGDRGPATATDQGLEARYRARSTTTMARTYTHAALTLWSLLLLVLPSIISAHMIEVPAGKKECFFEDLHINDKVRPHLHVYANYLTRCISTDDRNLPSRRRGTPGH